MALLENLGVPKDATICESIAAQAASDYQEGRISLAGLRLFLTVDATDVQGQHEHAQLAGPDFPLIEETTALTLLKFLQG